MNTFKNKVAVITGGASGIGWGLAERCAQEGMKVVIADVEETALKQAEKALKEKGAEVLAVRCDVSKLKDIETLAEKTVEKWGGVHLLFNNAGVNIALSQRTPLWEHTLNDWEWMLGVNLWGCIYGMKVFLPIMLKQNEPCHIVNTSSMAGLIAEPQLVIYAVTKAGVIALTEGLYFQLKQMNSAIGVSVLCPAFVASRMGEAERNRPARLQNPAAAPGKPGKPAESNQPSLAAKFRNKALTPAQSADLVFKAIREGQFYIFTDPLVQELFRQRAGNIIAGKNPERPSF